MRSLVFSWLSRRLVRVGIATLLAFLLVGGVALKSGEFFHPTTAHAAGACGTGITGTQYKGIDYSVSDSAKRYKVAANTCDANARSTDIRNLANNLSPAQEYFAFWGIIGSFFLGKKFYPALGASAAAFGGAGSVAIWKAKLTDLANKLQQANQACGTRGIYYEMVVIGNVTVRLEKFACQGSSGQPGGLPQTKRVALSVVKLASADTSSPDEFDDLSFLDDNNLEFLPVITFDDWSLVQGPLDDGGDRCGTSASAPYYTHDPNNLFDGYYQDSFIWGDDTSNTYQRMQWDVDTGKYDIYSGGDTRCFTRPAYYPPEVPAKTSSGQLSYDSGRICDGSTPEVIHWDYIYNTGFKNILTNINTQDYSGNGLWQYDGYAWSINNPSWTLTSSDQGRSPNNGTLC